VHVYSPGVAAALHCGPPLLLHVAVSATLPPLLILLL